MEYYVSGMMSMLVSMITMNELLNKSDRTCRDRNSALTTLALPLIYMFHIIAWITLSPWFHFVIFVCPHIALQYILARRSVSMDYVFALVYVVLLFHAIVIFRFRPV